MVLCESSAKANHDSLRHYVSAYGPSPAMTEGVGPLVSGEEQMRLQYVHFVYMPSQPRPAFGAFADNSEKRGISAKF